MIALTHLQPSPVALPQVSRFPRRVPGSQGWSASDLHAALRSDALDVWYQPIVPLAAGGPARYEALARWRHPELGMIPPDQFIPVAERTGLVVDLDRWVLRRACAQMALLGRTGDDAEAAVSVNLSVRSLQRPGLEAVVDEALASSGLPARRLTLELTETGRIDESSAVAARIAALRARGVRVALDDFGTGFTDFGYLCRLAVDELKLDRTLVAPRSPGPALAAVLGAVFGLARSLGLETVAEGIETAAQRDLVAGLGCTLGQGFLFGRPVPWLGATAVCTVA